MSQWNRVVITGASGFLGSHLVDAVLAEGAEVIGVDNLCTGSLKNLEHLRNEPRFSFEEHDICNPFDFGPVDYVFNFASPASPVDYLRLGPETLRVGAEGTRHALELARRYDAGFLHASTSECYGDPAVHPQNEEYWGNVNPVGPRSVYDEAKRYAEALVTAWGTYYGVQTGIARIFNTYGPRLKPNDGRVISALLMEALVGEDLIIYGDGQQTRSFCFYSDLVRGILALARSEVPFPVNLGNPQEYTILDCADMVLEITGAHVEVDHQPGRMDDPRLRKPDISMARGLLGWEPQVSLREGLQITMEYFKNYIKEHPERL